MSSQNKPIFAIITRTKDRGVLFERAIKSVANQTYKNYVHIILNDGGDKNAVEKVLQKYSDKNRIVIHNKQSVGIVPALNQAIRASKSDYVTILDDDDQWSPERLEVSKKYIEDHPEYDAHVVKMDTVIESIENGKIVKKKAFLHPESGEGEISLYKQCIRNYISNGVVTYTRKIYDTLGGYDESLSIGEDWDFGVRLLMLQDVGMVSSGPSLVYYHQRPEEDGNLENSTHGLFEVLINQLRNKYLRLDLENGRYGVGMIMNQEEYDLQKIVRLEGHVNHVGEEIRGDIQSDLTYTLQHFSALARIKKVIDRRRGKR